MLKPFDHGDAIDMIHFLLIVRIIKIYVIHSSSIYLPFQVVDVGQKFFRGSTAAAFSDPRLTLIFDDAARYLREEGSTQAYDVIICDSSDPVGPAEVLFQPEFFTSMRNALSPNGVVCTQGDLIPPIESFHQIIVSML